MLNILTYINKTITIKTLLIIVILFSTANHAEALYGVDDYPEPFGVNPFEYFNVYSLGDMGQPDDYYGSTDIQGTIGVAGNAYLTLSTGTMSTTVLEHEYALHTGGNLEAIAGSMGGKFDIGGSATISNYGIIYDIHSGGDVDLTVSGSGSAHVYADRSITKTDNWGISDAYLQEGTPYTPIFDFDALNQHFLDTSTAIAAMPVTGTAIDYYSTLSFNVESGINVFNVNISDLYDSETSIRINGPDDAIVYINALDKKANMHKSMRWVYDYAESEVSPSNVILNFPNATWLDINGTAVNILAPNAETHFHGGTIVGNLIVGDLPEGNQVNLGSFTPPTVVPEPSSVILFTAGIATLLGFRKRSK